MNRSIFTLFFIVGMSLSGLEAMKPMEENKNVNTKSVDTKKAFFDAVKKGDIKAVKEHLDQGGNVNATDGCGWTALQNAAMYGHADIVALLLERKAKIDSTCNNGETALHFAAWHGRMNIVALLLEHHAAVTVQGKTAIDHVLKRPKLLKLLEAGRKLEESN